MRGQASEIGATRVAQNGYQYIRTEQGWRLTHHVIASGRLGRPLNKDERVGFIDGDRRNLAPDNIEVRTKRSTQSAKTRLAILEASIKELQQERDRLVVRQDSQPEEKPAILGPPTLPVEDTKTCSSCNKKKLLSQFYGRVRKQSWCKSCMLHYQRERSARHR